MYSLVHAAIVSRAIVPRTSVSGLAVSDLEFTLVHPTPEFIRLPSILSFRAEATRVVQDGESAAPIERVEKQCVSNS